MSNATNRRGGKYGKLTGGFLCGTSLASLMLLALPTAAQAQNADRHWDANQTSVGSGGTGTWDTTSTLWSPNGDGVSGPFVTPWDNAALDNAIFGGSAGTVTLASPITVHNLTFNSANYVLTGSTLTLGGTAPTITVSNGINATIDSIIAGTSGLTKAGGGGLFLNGVNTFTGDINLDSGAIYAASDSALGAAGNNIFTAAGASVRLSMGGTGTSRTVTIGDAGTLVVQGAGAGSALITGNGGVSLVNGVTLSNDANTYTGRTTFNGVNGVGSIFFTSIGNLGEASSLGAPVTVENGTIVFNQSSQYSDNIIYTGDGDSSNRNWDLNGNAANVRNRGTGTLTITGDVDISTNGSFMAEDADIELLGVLSGGRYNFIASAGQSVSLAGANTFTGSASIGGLVKATVLADAGTVSSLGVGTDISLSAGTLSYTGTGDSSDRLWAISGASGILNDGSGALDLTGAAAFVPGGAVDSLTLGGSFAGTNTYDGVISGAGNLISDGAGTWVLGGVNTFTGSVTINNGTLRAGSASAFGNATGYVVNGGTLDLGGFDLVAPSLTGTGGAVALGGNTLTVNAKEAQAYGGSITGTGGLTKTGAGSLTLTGASTYTGATTVGGGTLTLDFSGAASPADNIVSGSSTLVLAGGALDVIGADSETNSQSFAGTSVTAGSTTIAASSGAGGTTNLDLGTITRTGGLVDFVLPDSGTITTANADGMLGGWATIAGADYAKIVGGAITAFEAADYTNKDDAGNWLTGEVISDAGGAADSPFFGTVTGSVQLGGLRYAAAAASTVTIAAGQTLGVDGTIIIAPSTGAANQAITGGFLTGGPGDSTLGVQQNGTGRFTIDSVITDNGGSTSFVKGGDGAVRLTAANSYTGSTTLSGGRLAVTSLANGGIASGIGASSADSANLVLESGTLAYVGETDAVTDRGFTLVNGGAVNPSIEVNADRTVEFSGIVTSPDDAGLTKTGWGTLVLSNAANDYVGVTTVTGGGSSYNNTLSVNTLADGGLVSGIGAASSDSANLVLSDGGRLQYTGTTTATDRGFTLASGNGGIDVSEASTTLTVSGTAVGAGSFVKDGAGTLILSGDNSYTGDTIITAGTLRAGSETAFGQAGFRYMRVDAGAMFDLGGFDIKGGGLYGAGIVDLGSNTLTTAGGAATFTGKITGTGGFTRGAGSYTQIISGCNNDYTGITTVSGNLSVDCITDGGMASAIGASGAESSNLVLAGGWFSYTGASVTTDRGFTIGAGNGWINVVEATTVLEFEGAAVGSNILVKGGAGTLLLSGANTYTGEMQVRDGTLRAGSDQAFGSSAGASLYDVAGVTLDLNGFDSTLGYLTGGGATGGNVMLGGATLTLNRSGGNASYGGSITGSGSLVKSGGSTQNLLGCDSSYTGSTTINGGVLAVSCLTDGAAASSIGSSDADASNLVLNGGTLRYVGAGGSTDRQFTLGASAGNALDASGTGAIEFTSTAPLTFAVADSAQTLTLTGTNIDDNILATQITDNGTGLTSLTKAGVGTWILTNADSNYTGVTRINGGVLGVDKLSDGGIASSIGASSADASNLIIGNGSTLRYTGAGDTTNRLFTLSSGVTFIESSGTGAIVFTDTGPVTLAGNNQNRTIAIGGTNTGNNTLAGSIGDAGTGVTTLAKNDSGTWVLTGENTYTGSTNINDGMLYLGDGGTTGSITSALVNNYGAMAFNRSDDVTFAGVITGTGSVLQAGTGTTVLTGDSTYTGGTTIDAGTLQLGDGGTSGSIVGNVTDNGELAFNRGDTFVFGGLISGTGTVSQIGTGTTVLTADNTYTGGTTISTGTLQIGNGGTAGSIVGDVVNDAALVFDRSDTVTFAGLVSGTGSVEQAGAGTTILMADNSYTGGTTISAGTLQLGNGGTTGSIVGDVLNDGSLVFNRSDALDFAGLVSGTGTLTQNGTGSVTLTGNNSYTGATSVNAGTLLVNGDQSAATGLTSVASGAALGGIGTIGGNVAIADGGILAPGESAGTLTIAGNLDLSSGSILNFEFGEAGVAGGALNDLVNVGGDLLLDGTINVTESAGGTFGGGIYRVFNYDGALTDNGLALGTLPGGSSVTVQTSVAGQVNLVNAAGLELNFWDGDAGPKLDDIINGGDGTWHLGGADNNWTDAVGGINAAYADGSFAIFTGAAGTVTVDNGGGAVTASGMQFASDGYSITGDALTLTDAQSTIRVGDGTATGADYVATIGAELTGAAQLVKTDLGTLVLTGANSYTGGTLIDTGTLQISSDANLGAPGTGITINDGTLHASAGVNTGRAVTLTGAATVSVQPGSPLTLTGVIDGVGSLTKAGGLVILTGENTYTGGTTIAEGTLQIGLGGTTGSIVGDVVNNASMVFNRGDDFEYAGAISGTGQVRQAGPGTTTLTGASTYTGDTSVVMGELRLADGGTISSTSSTTVQGADTALTVTGAGSALTTQTLSLTDSVVNVTDGGYLAVTGASQVNIGSALGSNGTVNVSGPDSLFDVAGSVVVANGPTATGIVNVTAGGKVQSGGLRIGATSIAMTTGSASVNISGAGSDWTSTGLTLGEGSMSVLDGGSFTTSGATTNLGTSGAGGQLLVSGAGSSATFAGDVNIGTDIFGPASTATGILTVADGALVDIGGVATLGNSTSKTGILNIGGAEGDPATGAGTFNATSLAFGPGTGRLNFNHTDAAYGFGTAMSGAGAINQLSGVTLLTGDSSGFSGQTSISGGALYVNNALGGDVSVATGGTLGGTGTIGGNVSVADGALNPGDLGTAPGMLTINGNLDLASASAINVSFGQANIVGGAFNDLIEVGGDLVLDGTLNVDTAAGGSFGPGLYRVINYAGALTNNGLAVGTIPSPDFYVQTSVAGQVNLVNTAGLTLRYWDGDTAASKNNSLIEGGNGLWQASTGNDNWTEETGAANAPFTDSAFAVFMGAAGSVTADGSLGAINASGMQFLTDGYVITGDAITLTGTDATIRVGDGSVAGAGITATIASVLNGASQLVKADLGTLILTGTNSYTGGTAINGGTLQVSADANLGGAAGGLSFDGGTLHTTADITSGRAVDLVGNGSFLTDAGTTLTLNGAITGAGNLGKSGDGILNLLGESTIDGILNANGGTVLISNGGSLTDYRGIIGDASGQTGEVIVSGAGSNWTNTSHIYVGYDGNGALMIEGGGTVSNVDGAIGLNGGSTGAVTVTGADSIWNTNGNLLVGVGGEGSLVVENGGTVINTSGSLAVGRDSGSKGSVTVTGIGSSITAAAMYVGNDGSGDLTIADGAELTSTFSAIGYSAGSSGTINIGAAAGQGPVAAGILNTPTLTFRDGDGTLVFNHTDTDYIFAAALDSEGTGTHAISHLAGTTLLTGDSIGFTGTTSVTGGTLLVGDAAGVGSLGGDVNVAIGATLGGSGTIGGNVAIADGGILSPGDSAGTLTIVGDLGLSSGSVLNFEFGEAGVVGGSLNDLVNVGGGLVLDGTINVTESAGGTFGPGIYRVFNYAGALTDNGLALGTMPGGSGVSVQTAISGQVNLVNTAGLALSFWDGTAGPKNNDVVDGGNGTWRVGGGNNNWTDMNGAVNADYAQDSFAIFSANSGTVTIDNSGGNVLASGMQFASDGYVLTGDALTLTGADATIQVGDGSAAGAGYTAAIDAELTGAAQLVKTDAGTLVLTGTNSYTGGTAINGGTLEVSADANLGGAAGGLSFDGGTLNTTADIAANRAINLVGGGTFLTDAGTTLALDGVVSGAGSLSKDGAGTLVLSGANSYTGGTTIDAGTLQIGDGGTSGLIIGDVANDGTLAFNRSDDVTFAGIISGSGAVNQIGTGATILTANSSYAGGTTISAGTLQLGDGGTTGSIVGDVANNGTLAFNRSNDVTFAGLVSGSGSLNQDGAGTTTLTGGNSYTGATNVNAGTLLVNGDQSAATGLTNVASGASLGGTGVIGGNVTLADGASLTPGAGGAGRLTIGGDLSLSSGSLLAFEYGEAGVAGGALNDLVTVGGDLTLDGTIDVSVTAGGAFGPGIYRVFDYGGVLTDNGLSLGTMPADSSVIVQTSISGQVNLVNSGGMPLNFWDGAAGPKFDGTVNGGDGVWQNGTGNDNWTGADGEANGVYADGSFAVFGGTGGTVTVDNSLGAVTSGGMQFASDGYVVEGDEITFTNSTTTIRVGDGSTAGADFIAAIDAVLTGDSQLVKTDAGTLILSGENSYTGGTAINGGVLQVSSDANLGDAAGGLTLNGGTLATSADMASERDIVLGGAGTIATTGDTTFTFDGLLSGTGALTKDGAGTLLLTGDSSGYTADTIVAAGTLAVDGIVGGAVTVNGGALLTGNGQVGNVSNAGVIAPGREDGFGSLTVGSYTGNGGVLEIETVFGGDSSQTDQLIVTGGTSGSTEVVVTNRGGLGEQTVEGIKIIDVTGGASDGDFMLRGDYLFEGETAIIAGAYGYRLNQGGVSTPSDGDWYLRSALLDGSGEPEGPLYQPGVPIYENYGQTLQALNNLPTLQERVGNRRWASTESGTSNGIWGRMESTRFRPGAAVSTASTDANIDSWKLQTGYDRTLVDDGGNMLVAGVTGHYGEANATVRSMFGNGTIKTKSYGVGATLTWYDHDGFYADAQAQFAWFDGELNSSVLGNLVDDNDGKGQAFGLEVGKRSVVGDGLTLTPQIQMTYQNVEFDTFMDPSQAVVASSKGDSLKTRWGMTIDHQKQWETDGANRRSHIYGGLNLSYEWLDGTQADVSGTPIRNANERLWGEAALGGSLGLNDSVTIYTQVSASSPFRNFGEDYSFKGIAGIRLAF